MQQPHLTGYADIGEVRMEVRAAVCNQLLADGWVLLGIYPLTTVGEMVRRRSGNSPRTPSGMCGASWVMLWDGGENRKARLLTRYLPLLTIMMMTDTAYGGQPNTAFG
jgi:hypothetical protein